MSLDALQRIGHVVLAVGAREYNDRGFHGDTMPKAAIRGNRRRDARRRVENCLSNPPDNPVMAKILVIDDDRTFSTLLAAALRDVGHEVEQAANGRDGVALVNAIRFDAVVTDIIMPDQEGIETIRKIRRRHPTLPILAMSAGSATLALDLLQIARALGANETLAKPFKPSELINRLAALLDGAADQSEIAVSQRA
jgi:CheY-like chemotaxis protein